VVIPGFRIEERRKAAIAKQERHFGRRKQGREEGGVQSLQKGGRMGGGTDHDE